MYKQITLIIIILIIQQINAQEKTNKIPVYDKSKIVGFLYEDTKLQDCEECYVLDSLKIFDKIIIFKSEALIIGLEDNKKQFTNLYTAEKTNKRRYFIIELNNTINSTSNKLYIQKRKGELFIFRQLSHNSSSTKIKKGKGDYTDYPSNYICVKIINKKIVNDTLNIKDLFKYKQSKECFHCPTSYSLEECLKMNNSKAKFEWN